jgi:hypothetical protein
MIRTTLTLLTLLFSFAFAQPVGQLYVHQGNNRTAELGYIDYPSEQYHRIEGIQTSDMVASNDALYAVDGYQQDFIYIYDRSNHQRIQSLTGTDPKWVDLWNDKLVVASTQAPFLRVYDPAQGYTENFSLLDSTVMPYSAIDMLVADDRAYLLLGESLVVVDLDLEDTLAVIQTPPPYLNQNQNTTLTDGGEHVYITVDYATGAIRSSLLKVNKLTLAVETAYHTEMYANRVRPVAVGDSVFVLQNFSHYDLSDDTLNVVFGPSQYEAFVVEYDPISEAIFTYGGVLAPAEIVYHLPSQLGNGVPIAALNQAHFAQATTTSIEEERLRGFAMQAYPNPTSDYLKLAWSEQQRIEQMRIINSKGQVVWSKKYDQFLQNTQIDVRDLSYGGYFLEVAYEDDKQTKAFVKW